MQSVDFVELEKQNKDIEPTYVTSQHNTTLMHNSSMLCIITKEISVLSVGFVLLTYFLLDRHVQCLFPLLIVTPVLFEFPGFQGLLIALHQ